MSLVYYTVSSLLVKVQTYKQFIWYLGEGDIHKKTEMTLNRLLNTLNDTNLYLFLIN